MSKNPQGEGMGLAMAITILLSALVLIGAILACIGGMFF